ncbi:MAG: DNA-3-methyladenine glycosylase [Clostridiaceae bacterium]
MKKLERSFFYNDTVKIARDLLGKILVHKVGDKTLMGKIVETEAYMGAIDKASHAYGNKKTDRTKALFNTGGHSYIYLIYGMYYCFNVVTNDENTPQCVLIRALEPVSSIEDFIVNRYKTDSNITKQKIKNLSNGPGKLCIAMDLNKSHNLMDLCGDEFYILDNNEEVEIVTSKRINIDYAEEAMDYPWRFYIKDNKYVSVK